MTALNDFCNRSKQAIDYNFRGDTGPAIRLFNKSSEQCEVAIGQTITVRTGPKTTVTGGIISAEPWRIRSRRKSGIVQAKVVMECGTVKKQREFFLTRLPS